MTLRKISTLLFLILASNQLVAQDADDTQNVRTVLFEISSPNSIQKSYIFGTHHAFGKAFFDTLSIANQALESCDLLIKESLNIPGEMAEDIINERKELTQWKKYLNKNDLVFIQDLFASSPTDYNKITPTELHVFLNRHFKQQVCLNKSPADSSLSLDDYIGSRAMAQNIEMLGLETIEEQLILINKDVEGMPRKVHKKRLHYIIDKIREANSNHCEETDWYSNLEIDLKINEPCRNSLLLTDRNNKWLPILLEKMESNECFIAVGLSHLMYECGLINQLTELGYSVVPLPLSD